MGNYSTVSVPKVLIEKVDEAIAAGLFTTKADFLKQSIRHELERQTLLDQRRKTQAGGTP